MIPLEELEFAQKFPFTKTSRSLLKQLNASFDSISEQTKRTAVTRISTAFKRKTYFAEKLEGHRELLENDLFSYPLAKVYLSVIDDSRLHANFAKSVSDSAFNFMEQERGGKLKLRLANELGIKVDMPSEKSFSVSVPDYLSSRIRFDSLKLVNQSVENGFVELNKERFSRFLAGRIFTDIIKSLPVSLDGVPRKVKEEALGLSNEVKYKRRAAFEKITGAIRPELFPPCMEKLYADLLEGKNLSHFARFDLTTFLNAVNLPESEIVKAFSNAPNFDEKITVYQVKKLIKGGNQGKGYSPASCSKIKTHALCVADCGVRHPTQFYRRELSKAKAKKQKPSPKKELKSA